MSYGSYNDGKLFSERPLENHLAGIRKGALTSIQSYGPRAMLDSEGRPDAGAIEELVATVCTSHRLDPVQFRFDEAEATPLTEDDGVMATSIVLPFVGHAALLRLNANHAFALGDEPRGTVVEATDADPVNAPHRLVFWLRSPHLDSEFDKLLNHRFEQLRSKTSWSNQLVGKWNTELEPAVRQAATARAATLARMAKTESTLSIPIRRVQEPAIELPMQRRTLASPQEQPRFGGDRQSPAESGREASEWVLADSVYEEVLRSLVLFAAAAGRLPRSTGKLSENDFRNFALLVLNANFDLTAARGEVFNGDGKSDLLVPWQGHNAFVGEFKKYRGSQSVTDALTQLLGYVTWADTAAALVIIIERSNVSAALAEIHDAVAAHRQHVRTLDAVDPSRRRDYIVASLHDSAREVRLAVIPIVVRSHGDLEG